MRTIGMCVLVLALAAAAGCEGPAPEAPAAACGGPTRPDAPADGPGPVRPPGVVAPAFGFDLACGDLISFDVPTGEPAGTPGRPAAPPADESSQTVPRPLDLDTGAGVAVSILSSAPGPAPDPFVTLPPGGPDDLSGG